MISSFHGSRLSDYEENKDENKNLFKSLNLNIESLIK
jgi:hypothetical protein